MFNLAPIIAGCLGGLFANSFAKKKKQLTSNGRFVFSEEAICKKMGRIAERFKLKIIFKLYGKYEYGFRLIGKSPFNTYYIKIFPNIISILPQHENYYFQMYDDSMPNCKANYFIDDYDTVGFSSDLSFNDMSDDEIFDMIEKIIEALYGAKTMTSVTAEAEDGRESFTFYLDAPDYYGYTETTEIGNFKFILNQENGGTENA